MSDQQQPELLDLAYDRSANRLTTAIAHYFAGDETDSERDLWLQDNRSVTVHTDAEGMIFIRAARPPMVGKHLAGCVETIVQRVAATPTGSAETGDASADAYRPPLVASMNTVGGQGASADASEDLSMADLIHVRGDGTTFDRTPLRRIKPGPGWLVNAYGSEVPECDTTT